MPTLQTVNSELCKHCQLCRLAQNWSVSFVFYDVFLQLCNSVNKSPSAVVQELGMNKSAVTNWKTRGSTPTGANLQKIADYFNVSVPYLREEDEEKTSPATMTEDEELQYVLEQYRTRPCLRMLFKVSDKATAKHVYQAAEQIEALNLLEQHKAAEE